MDANPLKQLGTVGDLNKVSEEELQQAKNEMQVVFEANKKDRYDPDFEYDVQRDFKAVETSGWDEDDDNDDDDDEKMW